MELSRERKNEILGIFLSVLAILLGISLFVESAGIVGLILKVVFMVLAGKGAYLFPILLFLWGVTLIRSRTIKVSPRLLGLNIILCTFLTFLHVLYIPHGEEFPSALEGQGGGIVGCIFAFFLRNFFDQIGTYIILGAAGLVGLLFLFDILLMTLFATLKRKFKEIYQNIIQWFAGFKEKVKNLFAKIKGKSKTDDHYDSEEINEDEDNQFLEELKLLKKDQNLEVAASQENLKNPEMDNRKNSKKSEPKEQQKTKQVPTPKPGSSYRLPPLKLLTSAPGNTNKPTFVDQSKLLEDTLQNFGVKAKVINVSHGPTITRYELQPAPGVKVSRIVNLADDIALSMAATDVRIVAPIPGKAAVGVEVPNPGSSLVKLKDILDSDLFKKSKSKLTLALGVDIAGEPVVADLTSMPHLLVAGATGSGKSVCINTLILSILYKAKPDEVKLLLIDPKKVEMTAYKDLPHLLAPVVTDPKKASAVLKMVVQEMENRYELFAETGTRGIEGYNQLMRKRQEALKKARNEGEEVEGSLEDYKLLPYIVVIIDELADLMMVAANDVEDAICRLAQMARAAGIHLIIATQRPSVDVITGLIKANIPSRIAFAVSSQVDSRTILDTIGAEKLLGKGDMLFSPIGTNKPRRVQGAFVTTEEVQRVVEFVKRQKEPEYASAIQQLENGELVIDEDEERDELYEEAVRIVVSSSASISMLQRRLRIGYTRAARLIDMMERDGIVGPYAGSKPREVLISESEVESILKEIKRKKNQSIISNDLRDDK
ncbi:FtsK/SpoIIIE family DNA translocase [Anoxybacter fermentans]|nr:DNA translocase FtsK [Anoxybacter fermentans]